MPWREKRGRLLFAHLMITKAIKAPTCYFENLLRPAPTACIVKSQAKLSFSMWLLFDARLRQVQKLSCGPWGNGVRLVSSRSRRPIQPLHTLNETAPGESLIVMSRIIRAPPRCYQSRAEREKTERDSLALLYIPSCKILITPRT